MIRRSRLALVLLLTCATGLFAISSATDADTRAFADATDAWEHGDYISALTAYTKILDGAAGDAFVDRIALQTGELFVSHELTPDGRAPRFSPNGKFIAYETGLEVSRQTRILRNDATRELVAELPGASATFSADSTKVAYIKIPASTDITAASQALERAELTASNRSFLINNLTWLIARDATITTRDLSTQRETELATPGLLKTGLAYAPDGRAIYFLGGRESDQTRTDIFAIAEGGQPAIVADAPGLKSAPTVAATAAALIYTVPTANPVRRPVPPQPPAPPAAAPSQPAATAPAAAPAPSALPGFGVVDLTTRRVLAVTGTAPTLSDDGKTLAYVTASGGEATLMAGSVLGTAAPIKRMNGRLDAPALSPDGSRVTYQRMDQHDWEIYVAKSDGSDERRLTRDIQHDVLPRFVAGGSHVLWVVGEPRHRRSFLLDLASPAGTPPTKLFHNNTIRTIAPEYQWAASPDGGSVLIGAERDGNTVSPPRGIYALDLKQKVTKTDLLLRLKAGLEGETALKANGTRIFQPIAAKVRDVVENISIARIYDYEKALYDFDSKHITRPGNRKASEYLFNTYESFGYTPEYQWFQPPNALGGTTANVVATLRGTVNPELVYVISSHYDSVAGGPGADDNSSGTTALLEAARVLADHPMPATIVFASMTGEESGLLGSREFVRRSFSDRRNVVGALNNDMIGWSNNQRIDNTIRYSNPGIRDIQHGAAMLFSNLITYDALYWKGTDAASYYDTYGDIVGGIGSYPVLSSPFYHQPTDVLENINHEQVAETSKTTVATIMLLASSPSRLKDVKVQRAGTGASVSWTPSPETGVTSYIVAYGPASDPYRRRVTVNAPSANLEQIAAGDIVSVKGVNAQGLEGWSWATGVAP